jgi:hypothetical protein
LSTCVGAPAGGSAELGVHDPLPSSWVPCLPGGGGVRVVGNDTRMYVSVVLRFGRSWLRSCYRRSEATSASVVSLSVGPRGRCSPGDLDLSTGMDALRQSPRCCCVPRASPQPAGHRAGLLKASEVLTVACLPCSDAIRGTVKACYATLQGQLLLKEHDALGWLLERCTAWGRSDLLDSGDRLWGALSLLVGPCGCRSHKLSTCPVVASVGWCPWRVSTPAIEVGRRVGGR